MPKNRSSSRPRPLSFPAGRCVLVAVATVAYDPTHGRQQLTLFHGFYGQYQYLPLAITCAENDFVVLVGLRFGTCRQIRRGGVAAEVKVSARRALVRLSASWPYLGHFAEVSGKVLAMPPTTR